MKTCCKNEEDYQNWKQPQETKTGSKNEEEHQIMKATWKYEDDPQKIMTIVYRVFLGNCQNQCASE